MILYSLLGFQTSGTMDPFFVVICTYDENIVYAEGLMGVTQACKSLITNTFKPSDADMPSAAFKAAPYRAA